MPNIRPDISEFVVHFTRGESQEEACGTLETIIEQRCLLGSNNLIKGAYSCICFSEAPMISLADGLVNPGAYSRYTPFGVMFEKRWLFERGGRPVIYQPDAEFGALPEQLRWRHVRYEPGVIDFTWEREWRIKTDRLDFDPKDCAIVVPSAEWANRILAAHQREQEWRVFQYSLIMDEFGAEQQRERFPWRILCLR